MKIARWTLVALLGFTTCGWAQTHSREQDNVLFFNAEATQQGRSCVVPRAWVWRQPVGQCPLRTFNPIYATQGRRIVLTGSKAANEIYLDEDFFIQGRDMELQVVNRKFLTDYQITIDQVTHLQTGPNVRNLDEASNLSLGPASFASFPPSKGGTEGLTARTATQILLQLVEETTSSQPETDLNSDVLVIERERAKLKAQIADFTTHYDLVAGSQIPPNPFSDCDAAVGSPAVIPLRYCLEDEFDSDSMGLTEGEFQLADLRVRKLIGAVNDLGKKLSASDLPNQLVSLAGAIAQYENDLNILTGNLQAAADAAQLAGVVSEGFRTQLRRQEIKVRLLEKLKAADSKATLDDAEMNNLLDQYAGSAVDDKGSKLAIANGNQLITSVNALRGVGPIANALCNNEPFGVTPLAMLETDGCDFRGKLELFRTDMAVTLPNAINEFNQSLGRLLFGMNEIYDRSRVAEPLRQKIGLGGLTDNISARYTIWEIDNFQRYKIHGVREPGAAANADAGVMTLPPAKGAADSGTTPANGGSNPASSSNPTATAGTAASPSGSAPNSVPPSQGIAVAHGSIQVHELYQANVVAAVAWSSLKDQSITAQAQPLACIGTAAIPDPNCFAPLVTSSYKWSPIVGLDYYFQSRDTYPRTNLPWLCSEHPWQCFGLMGAASATKANNYFLGGFFEPVLGVQFGAGANFGTRTVLASPYARGVPVDITGDFPTHDGRGTGFFISAGLDLTLFRKVFGKFTGIGTSASGSSAQ